MFRCGAILHHRNFVFGNGTAKDKYLMIIGSEATYLIATTITSNGKRYRMDAGCQSGNRHPAFHLPIGTSCLPKSSWICLNDFYRLNPLDLLRLARKSWVRKIGRLGTEQARSVQLCAISCPEIERRDKCAIRASLVPLPTST